MTTPHHEVIYKAHIFWLKQLHKEYEHIKWKFGLTQLRSVLIQLATTSQCWGAWDPARRTIILNPELLYRYPWHIILEILKHEMAHQYACEVLHAPDAHGEGFKQACYLLRVAPWARKAHVDLNQDLTAYESTQHTPEQDALLKKVKKLLALGNSCNANEALAAMEKVRVWLDRYQLNDLMDQSSHEAFKTVIIRTHKKRLNNYNVNLLNILKEFYKVFVCGGMEYDKTTCQEFQVFEITGLTHHVDIAEYVFHFVSQRLEALWLIHKETSDTRGGVAEKNAFRHGVLRGLESNLKKNTYTDQAADPSHKLHKHSAELALKQEAALANHMDYMQPRLRNKKQKKLKLCAEAYHAGEVHGKNLHIKPGLKHSQTDTRHLKA